MASRFTLQCLRLSPHLLRAGFVGCAILYALLSVIAEAAYVRGSYMPLGAGVPSLTLARMLFPIDHRFRRGLADYCAAIRWKGSRPIAETAIRAALDTDFYSFDLHRDLAGLYYEGGDRDRAFEELAILHAFLPGTPIVMPVNINPATD